MTFFLYFQMSKHEKPEKADTQEVRSTEVRQLKFEVEDRQEDRRFQKGRQQEIEGRQKVRLGLLGPVKYRNNQHRLNKSSFILIQN